jgi:hypothetical protein
VSVRLALGVAVLVPLVPWSQARIDRFGGGFRAQEEVLYVWSGEHVKRLLPGFEAVAADIYWLRTVQYFGGQRLFAGNKRFELLRPLAEITVTLDPRLEIAYRYGAVFLSENPPIGAGRPQEGIELLEMGARNLPRSWRLRQDLGFFRFLFLKDADRAAATLSRAAEIPGAPFWLRTMAADLAAKGGDRASARRMWQQMYDQADQGLIKENARARLLIYDSLDAADRLGELVRQVEQRSGYRVRRLEELRERGLWPGPLTDAAGVPFRYDVSTGRASIAHESPMWRPD